MGNLSRNALQAGQQIHWYAIKHILGQGGFGITYLAEDKNLRQPVAIKEYFPTEFATREDDTVQPRYDELSEQYRDWRNKFIVEAQTLARFDHPNVVRVLSVFEANGTAYMVMRFEEGASLEQKIFKRQRLDYNALMQLLLPLLDALEHVHASGFLHRDIKPANIFMRNNGLPVLLDFGAARQALGMATSNMTMLVSAGYAPIEQYQSNSELQGPWTDIYACGATLYRAVVGLTPHAAIERSNALLRGSSDCFVPAAEAARGEYPNEVLQAIDHALALRERDRPQNISEWRAEFDITETKKPSLRRIENKLSDVTQNPHTGTGASNTNPKSSSHEISISAIRNRPAIAVLPFTNLSDDPEQAFFADALTDDIITGLSLWRWLPVIARNSVFTYKDRAVDIRQIGTDLGARYIVEGSVRKAGQRIRVNARLLDTTTSTQVWTDRYDRNITDLFDLQEEMMRSIVSTIVPEIDRAEKQRIARKRPEDLSVWELVARGNSLYAVTREGNTQARELFLEAIRRDPEYAEAYSGVAGTDIWEALQGWTDDPVKTFQHAEHYANHAAQLDPRNGENHANLAITLLWNRQDDLALQEISRAVQLNPISPFCHFIHSVILLFSGNIEKALSAVQTAHRLSPKGIFQSMLLATESLCYFITGKFDDAIASARHAIQVQDTNLRAHIRLAAALACAGDMDGARAALDACCKLMPGLPRQYLEATHPFRNPEHLELLLAGLRLAGWKG